jgi:hypothetical protein
MPNGRYTDDHLRISLRKFSDDHPCIQRYTARRARWSPITGMPIPRGWQLDYRGGYIQIQSGAAYRPWERRIMRAPDNGNPSLYQPLRPHPVPHQPLRPQQTTATRTRFDASRRVPSENAPRPGAAVPARSMVGVSGRGS